MKKPLIIGLFLVACGGIVVAALNVRHAATSSAAPAQPQAAPQPIESSTQAVSVDGMYDHTIYSDGGVTVSSGKAVNGSDGTVILIGNWKKITQGILIKEANYDRLGKKSGVQLVYGPNGIVILRAVYNEGKKNGVSEMFDDNGRLMWSKEYKDDILNGMAYAYDANGSITYSAQYENDIEVKP